MSLVRGFAVGRTIFGEAARQWFDGDINDAQLVSLVESNYAEMVDLWQKTVGAA